VHHPPPPFPSINSCQKLHSTETLYVTSKALFQQTMGAKVKVLGISKVRQWAFLKLDFLERADPEAAVIPVLLAYGCPIMRARSKCSFAKCPFAIFWIDTKSDDAPHMGQA
jgi:hypothetical protein